MIEVVFVEPESPGNVGFMARTMKNFGLERLVLINPCNIGEEAHYHAMHAQDVLDNCKTYPSLSQYLDEAEADFLVGTTGTPGGSYNVSRIAVTPEKLSYAINLKSKIALIFGREGDGLTNHEIDLCDVVVTIPTSDEYPIMNISHAAAVIFYELYKNVKTYPVEEIRESSRHEREDIADYMDWILQNLDYPSHKHQTTLTIFRRILGRAFITGREAHSMKGVFRKIRDKMINDK
ncbi:MAG TPA: TrmJ/YjtD family RNA methyltransferase [Methanobacteriaceae archaeon]|nr:TrmJ/YjtD family RNA methyltransferase [Methanobacteriaceae archaeon]